MSVKELLEKAERCIRPPSSFCEKAHGFLSQALVTLENQPDLEALNKQLLEACEAAQIMLLQTEWNGDDRMDIVTNAIEAADKILGGK